MDEVLSYLRLFAPEVERIGMLIWQKNQESRKSQTRLRQVNQLATRFGRSGLQASRTFQERLCGFVERSTPSGWFLTICSDAREFSDFKDETQRLEMPLIAYTDALVRARRVDGSGPDREAIGHQLAEMTQVYLGRNAHRLRLHCRCPFGTCGTQSRHSKNRARRLMTPCWVLWMRSSG